MVASVASAKPSNAGLAPDHPSDSPAEPAIREARKDDFEQIMGIESSCFPGHLAYSREQMRYLITRANSRTLVEEKDGVIRGYVIALFRKNSETAGIETFGVSPQFQGQGVGKRLLSAAEEVIASRGGTFSRLEVSAGNATAISVYKNAGYSIVSTLPEYYIHDHHGTRDAIRMLKKLG